MMGDRRPEASGWSALTLGLDLTMLGLASSSALCDDAGTTLVYPPFGHCLGLHKVTDFHRFIYLGARTELDDPRGIAAVKLRERDDPSTGSADDELTVFGLNSGRCEIIFNRSLYEASVYGECGDGEGQFRAPLGIAADERGNVFVADTGNDRVVRLLYTDGSLRWVRTFGSTGSGERQFRRPTAVSVGASGTVYVCDSGNDRIVVLTSTGDPLRTIRGDIEQGVMLERPCGMAVVEDDDPWIASGRGAIVVSDRNGTRLLAFSTGGRLLRTLESGDLPIAGEARFGALAIDFYGNVYAIDGPNGAIHKVTRELIYVDSFGRPGDGDGRFDDPRGITLWRRFGQIFVTERDGAQYLWIGVEIQDLSVEPSELSPGGPPLRLSYRLTETSRVTLKLLDGRGRQVAEIVSNRRRRTGANTERWDRVRGAPPEGLAPGRYTLRLEARPTYSSGKYFQDIAEIEIRLLD